MSIIEVILELIHFFLSHEKHIINIFSNLCASMEAYFVANMGPQGKGGSPGLCPRLVARKVEIWVHVKVSSGNKGQF